MLRRRRPARSVGTTGTDPAAEAPATKRTTQAEIDKQFRSWPPRRIASWALMSAAVLVVVQHLLAHGGFRPLSMSMARQDIFFGYPVAGLLAFGGLLLIDPRPRL